jgi:hypothetical protein
MRCRGVGREHLAFGRALFERADFIAIGFALVGGVVAALIWYLVLFVLAPYRQRDDARKGRTELLAKLNRNEHSDEALAALGTQIASGSELKERGQHLSVVEGEPFENDRQVWDAANIEVLERYAPGFVPDYRYAEEPIELFEKRSVGSSGYQYKYLPPDAQIEVKLRSLRANRDQLRGSGEDSL